MYRHVVGKFSPNKHRYTRETLEKKHNLKIGDRVKVSMNVASSGKDAITEKEISCKIIGLHEKFVTLKTRFGYTRSILWSDFEKALE